MSAVKSNIRNTKSRHVDSPGEWGFTESDEGVYAKSPNATNAFEVKLLGRRKVGRPAPVVPLELSEIVTLYEGVGYDEVRSPACQFAINSRKH